MILQLITVAVIKTYSKAQLSVENCIILKSSVENCIILKSVNWFAKQKSYWFLHDRVLTERYFRTDCSTGLLQKNTYF